MSHALRISALVVLSGFALSCATSNPNTGRVLTSIQVTPATADAQNSNGQVLFTATGNFNLPPSPAPVTFAAPYVGSFVVDNPTSGAIATIVSTGTGTVTVQCVSGASGTVAVVASAASNNALGDVVSGSGQLTCP